MSDLENQIEPRWTDAPHESGAYWMQVPGAAAEICWIHDGQVWFTPPLPGDMERWAEYLEYQALFYGPIAKPPPMPEKQSDTKELHAT